MFFHCTRCGQETGLLDQDCRCQKDGSVLFNLLRSRRLRRAGILILKNQEDKIGITKEQEFVLRNWSYYELQTKIKYKADKAGIELIIG